MNRNRSDRPFVIRLRYNELIIGCLFILLFLPYTRTFGFPYMMPDLLYRGIRYLRYVAYLVIPLLAFVLRYRPSVRLLVIVLLYELALFVPTFLNDGDMNDWIVSAVELITLCILFDMMIHRFPKVFLDASLAVLWTLTLVNLISILRYPDGMFSQMATEGLTWSNWFLGYRNHFIRYFLLAIILGEIRARTTSSYSFKIIHFIMMGLMFFSVSTVNSATSTVGVALLILYIIFQKPLGYFRLMNYWVYTLVNGVVFAVVIILGATNSVLSYFVTDVLDRDITFTGRNIIWRNALGYFLRKPILGNGMEAPMYTARRLANQSNAHNMYLWQLYTGGIVLFIVFCVLLFTVFRRASYRDSSGLSAFVSFALFVLMLMWQVEVFDENVLIFSVLVVTYNISCFEPLARRVNKSAGAEAAERPAAV